MTSVPGRDFEPLRVDVDRRSLVILSQELCDRRPLAPAVGVHADHVAGANVRECRAHAVLVRRAVPASVRAW